MVLASEKIARVVRKIPHSTCVLARNVLWKQSWFSFVYRNHINSWKYKQICSSTVAPHPSPPPPLNNNALLYGLLGVFNVPEVLRLFRGPSYYSWRYINPSTAAAVKTSLKKLICVLSIFIAIITTHLLCQMKANFL